MSEQRPDELPEVWYGNKPPASWRELPDIEDPDDEEEETPDDVIDILGFDPLEEEPAEDKLPVLGASDFDYTAV